jgi:hypothetical protein
LTAQDDKGVLKVADFGLGRFLHAGEVADTGGVGTPLYMAPEILQWLVCYLQRSLARAAEEEA